MGLSLFRVLRQNFPVLRQISIKSSGSFPAEPQGNRLDFTKIHSNPVHGRFGAKFDLAAELESEFA